MAKQKALSDYMVTPIEYPVCINGCMLINNNNKEVIKCLACNNDIYNNKHKHKRSINMLPLTGQLGLLLSDASTRRDLLYRANHSPDDSYDSIFSGSQYQSQKHRLFTNPYDLAIGLYVDGFTSPKKPSHKLTMVHVVVYNYHPLIRY